MGEGEGEDESYANLVAVGRDEVHLAVFVQVGRDDLGQSLG